MKYVVAIFTLLIFIALGHEVVAYNSDVKKFLEGYAVANKFLTDYDKVVSLALQVITISVALATAIIAVRIQSKSKRDKEIESSIACVEYWRSDEFLATAKRYDAIAKKVVGNPKALAVLSSVENRESQDFKHVHDYLIEFEKIGLKIRNKTIAEDIVQDDLGLILFVQYNHVLSHFINGVHKWYPGVYKNTEYLYARWHAKNPMLVKSK